jgi:hypothetical protein
MRLSAAWLRPSILVGFAFFVMAGLFLHRAYLGAWTPSTEQIAELEGGLRIPQTLEAGPLQDYVRHYAGVTEFGRRIIVGVLVKKSPDDKPGVYIGNEAELPRIADGGCGIVTVRYDPSSKEIRARCNGYG